MDEYLFDDLFDEIEPGDEDIDYGKPIATKLDSQKSSDLFLQYSRGQITAEEFDTEMEGCIVREGMTAEEIKQHFPPDARWRREGKQYNRAALIKAIILEERRLVGKQRTPGNVRNFWYTNLMYTIMKTLGDTSVTNILSTFSQGLTYLVRNTDFRYDDINLLSEKSDLCRAIFKDSPYPNIIIASEKASYHDHLKRLADVFKITFISLGGQGSYKVYEDLVTQFIELGIDIDQEFFIYCISDYDPEGYYIQDTAKDHLQCAGIRQVTIKRIYLRDDQITPGMVERLAIPYEWKKSSESATKSALTKYNSFGFRTGGIYKRGDKLVRFPKNRDGYDVPEFRLLPVAKDENQEPELGITPAKDETQKTELEIVPTGYDFYRIELDNFLPEVLLHLLIDAFEKDIDGGEYFKQKARLYLQGEDARHIVQKEAWSVAEHKARDSIREFIFVQQDLGRELSQKNRELEGDEGDLEDLIRLDYEGWDESRLDNIREKNEEIEEIKREKQSEIEEVENEIDDIQDYRGELYNRYYEITEFFRRVERQRSAGIKSLYNRFYKSINEPITGYVVSVQDNIYPDVQEHYQDLSNTLASELDFSNEAGEVFSAARSGKESFDPQLDSYKERELRHGFSEAVSKRSKIISSDGFYNIPEPPEEVAAVPQVAEEIREALSSVERKELDPRDQKLLMGLYKLAEEDRLYILFRDTDTPWEDIVLGEIEDE